MWCEIPQSYLNFVQSFAKVWVFKIRISLQISIQNADFFSNLKSSSACGYVTKHNLRYLAYTIPHRVNFKNIILKVFRKKTSQCISIFASSYQKWSHKIPIPRIDKCQYTVYLTTTARAQQYINLLENVTTRRGRVLKIKRSAVLLLSFYSVPTSPSS
jgi:hypothetical protein